MKITRQDILLSELQPNTGQIPGVPCNPRKISDASLAKLSASIESLPEMLDQRPLIVYPLDGCYVVLGGNMRLAALERLGWNSAPCAVLPSVTSAKRLREWVLKDNNLYGEHDYDILSEWDIDEVTQWGGVEWDELGPLSSEEEKKEPEREKEYEEVPDEDEGGPDFFDMMLLGGGSLEKLFPGGNVVKEVTHLDSSTGCTSVRKSRYHASGIDRDLDSGLSGAAAGLQSKAADRGNGWNSLSAETECTY